LPRARELRKSTQAEAIAWSMRSYKAGHLAQQAAMQAQPRSSYSGVVMSDETERRDKIAKTRAKTATALHQCVAELAECQLAFRDAGCIQEAAALAAKQDSLRHCAEVLGPPTRAQILSAQVTK
jgi:hypothetical protein